MTQGYTIARSLETTEAELIESILPVGATFTGIAGC